MDFPAYWLRRPEFTADTDAFDQLLAEAVSRGPDEPIDYRLDAPKWQFLCHAADRAGVVLHGTGDGQISVFEPRQPADLLDDSKAVYAASDGLWPMYFAIVDRVKHPMLLVNSCSRMMSDTGQVGEPHYFFSVTMAALEQRPWRSGTVYLLPGDTFEPQPPHAVGEWWKQTTEVRSPVAVRPVAKLTVDPADFPFLDQIRGHDDSQIQSAAAADPHGFPWLQE